jgi:geranylgeranyl diphosphate synthase type I
MSATLERQPATTRAELPQSLRLARELVEPSLREAVATLTPAVRRVAEYHFGWVDAAGQRADGRGKAVRPALILQACAAAGASPETAVAAGVAVECVHNFSLLHDDVMDGDAERRHRPTAWAVFGPSAAILTGDALLTLASQVMHAAPGIGARRAERRIATATQALIAGQIADLDFEHRDDVTLAACIAMAQAKTAALIACSTAVGALMATNHLKTPPPVLLALETFGSHLGLAFQLVDDLLGIWGSPEVTGKPVGADLRTRKKSLPVVAALRSGSREANALRALYGRHEAFDDEAVQRAADLVEGAGGRAWATREADRQLHLACAALQDVPLEGPAKDELVALAGFVTRRDR